MAPLAAARQRLEARHRLLRLPQIAVVDGAHAGPRNLPGLGGRVAVPRLSLVEIDRQLKVWADWCYHGRTSADGAGVTCQSAESHWQSPQCWDAPPPRQPAPHAPTGERVQSAYAKLPAELRKPLAHWYLLSVHVRPLTGDLRVHWCARRCGLAPPLFALRLGDARDAIGDLLST